VITNSFPISLQVRNPSFVWFKSTLRKNTFFGNIPNSVLYPSTRTILRLLNLLIFSGNKTRRKDGDPKQIESVSSAHENFLLYDDTLSNPYYWFELDPLITDFNEQLLFENIVLTYGKINTLSLTVPNCSHSLDGINCVRCPFNYILDFPTHQCLFVSTVTFEQTLDWFILNAFLNFKNNSDFVSVDNSFNASDDFYATGNHKEHITETWGLVNSVNLTSPSNATQTNLFKGTLANPPFNTNDCQIINIELTIQVNPLKNGFVPELTLYLADTSLEKTVFIKQPFDQINFLGNSKYFVKAQAIIYPADMESTITFDKVNFFINTLKGEISSIDVFNSKLGVFNIDLDSLNNMLLNAENGFPGKIHSTTFPMEFGDKSNIYFPHKFYEYTSNESSSFVSISISQKFLSESGLVKFFRPCAVNCLQCTSITNCVKCESSFYIKNGKCSACSEDCFDCVDHASKCTACSSTPNAQISLESKHFFF
jgi:hypothetical protein